MSKDILTLKAELEEALETQRVATDLASKAYARFQAAIAKEVLSSDVLKDGTWEYISDKILEGDLRQKDFLISLMGEDLYHSSLRLAPGVSLYNSDGIISINFWDANMFEFVKEHGLTLDIEKLKFQRERLRVQFREANDLVDYIEREIGKE